MEFNATIIVSAVSFIVFIIIMNTILYRPILRIIDERNGFIDSNIEESNSLKEKAKAILQEKEARIKEAHKAAKNTVAQGVESSKNSSSQSVSEAIAASREKIEAEKLRLAQEEGGAKEALKANVFDLAKGISEKLLGQEVHNFEYDHKIVDEAINNA